MISIASICSVTHKDFVYGLQLFFTPSYVGYSIIKSVVYAFIISSVASYYGYCVKGGALQVGASSTRAVVNSSVLILFWDLLLTNILLVLEALSERLDLYHSAGGLR